MKKAIRRFLSIITSILLIAVIGFLLALIISTATKGYINVFGYALVTVQSSSMTASGIMKGSTYLIHDKQTYNVGDVVAFYKGNDIWFHEIIEITENGIITKGSSNASADPGFTQANQIIGALATKNNFNWFVSVEFRLTLVLVIYAFSMGIILREVIIIWKEDEELTQEQKVKLLTRKLKPKIKKKGLLKLIPILFIPLTFGSLSVLSNKSENVDIASRLLIQNSAENFVIKNKKVFSYNQDCKDEIVIIPEVDSNGVAVNQVKENAFGENQYIKEIVIHDNITNSGWLLSLHCPNLKRIIVASSEPMYLASFGGGDLSKDVEIYVPDESVNTYKNTPGWSAYNIFPMSSYK